MTPEQMRPQCLDLIMKYQILVGSRFTRYVTPPGKSISLFREALAKAGLIEKLFERFGQHLEAKGYIARGGQMIDATIVPVPKQRNSRDK